MAKKLSPHCTSAYHYAQCVNCRHERWLHIDEKGICKDRECDCVHFDPAPNYEPLEHVTIPIGGIRNAR